MAKMGAPIKYKEEYCELLVNHMTKGYSFNAFGSVVDCGAQTLYDWTHRYPEFMEAKDIGQAKALAFYEKILAAKISGAEIPGFDPKKSSDKLLEFSLKTRFHKLYGDKMEISNPDGSLKSNVTFYIPKNGREKEDD